MTLNPFFLQGSSTEQFLIQDLINEQLKIYGIEVYYLPRAVFKSDDILGEIETSHFDDNYVIEAYLDNYEGYAPGSDIMTKFGLRLKNEINLVISRERFEDFISEFILTRNNAIELGTLTDREEYITVQRPREGDLIYFPLGERLFEIKRVEAEKPFYQLGKTYVFELQCELYEYETGEVIDTSLQEINETIKDEGYITSLTLVGLANTASLTPILGGTGMVSQLVLNDDGHGYTSSPTVAISTAPAGGVNATAVAITTSRGGVTSVESLRITNPGSGYLSPPTVTISGGGGTGAASSSVISNNGIAGFTISGGSGYITPPDITITDTSTTVPTTYNLVTTASSIENYTISGTDRNGTINEENDPPITLRVGDTVVFDNSAIYPSHPLFIRVSSGGDSVSNPAPIGAGTTTVSWTPSETGSAVYQCGTHPNMMGEITILPAIVGGQGTDVTPILNESGSITSIQFTNTGFGYTQVSDISISLPSPTAGVGTFKNGEIVTGETSGTTAYVRDFNRRTDIDILNPPIELKVANIDGKFSAGESIVGSSSSARYIVKSYDDDSYKESYDFNEEFETEADSILDFTEKNPFGDY